MGAHVLVVDDDPQILRMLSDVLTKRGFGVDTANDGEEAYTRAMAQPPDLLVTDVMMPKLDGWSLVRKLRLEPQLATLPVIFLTAITTDDARVQAFHLGADDYVNKPFKIKDLVARIEKVLRSKRPDAKKPDSGLAGDLTQVGLSTLLVLVEMERKTGVLQVDAADGRSGRMMTREGKVIDASLDGAKQPTGAEAVYVMLTWTAGKFRFAVGPVDAADKIQQSTTHLLMEGARLMDEASAPEAEAQLDVDAIAEFGFEEPTPMVAAAKLADLVRRSARSSVPPYGGHALSQPELAELAAKPTAAAVPVEPVKPVAPPKAMPVEPAKPVEPRASRSNTPVPGAARSTPSGPDIAAALAAAAEAGVDEGDFESETPAPHSQVIEPVRDRAVTEPPVRRRKRTSVLWLVLCLLAAGAGAATFAIKPETPAPVGADLRHDASAIAAAFDRGREAAQMRAEGLAQMPMLRAGIETDAATLQDMISNEMMLKPATGEVIELFQVRDGTPSSVLRMPADGTAIDPSLRVRTHDGTIEVVATTPIKNTKGDERGSLAVALPIDLKEPAAELARHVQGATLTGLDQPIVLVPVGTGKLVEVNQVVKTKAAPDLALVAQVTAPVAQALPWLEPARYGALALAGLLLLVYIALLAARR